MISKLLLALFLHPDKRPQNEQEQWRQQHEAADDGPHRGGVTRTFGGAVATEQPAESGAGQSSAGGATNAACRYAGRQVRDARCARQDGP